MSPRQLIQYGCAYARSRLAVLAALLIWSGHAVAESAGTAPQAQSGMPLGPDFIALLRSLGGLAVVIGLILACGWLARRFGLQSATRGRVLSTIGSVSLGGKERVAVVAIGNEWLVLGASAGSVTLLHTLPALTDEKTAATNANPAHERFAKCLSETLKRGLGKPYQAADQKDY